MKLSKVTRFAVLGIMFAAGGALAQDEMQPGSEPQQQPQEETQQQEQPQRMGAEKQALSQEEKDFIQQAAQSNRLSVSMAQLAGQRAQSARVKQFAQRLAQDHQSVADQLLRFARQYDVSVPEQLTSTERQTVAELRQMRGNELDRQYIDDTIKHHQEMINAFEKIASEGQTPELRRWAINTLPSLRLHLMQAENIRDQVLGPQQPSGEQQMQPPEQPSEQPMQPEGGGPQ